MGARRQKYQIKDHRINVYCDNFHREILDDTMRVVNVARTQAGLDPVNISDFIRAAILYVRNNFFTLSGMEDPHADILPCIELLVPRKQSEEPTES